MEEEVYTKRLMDGCLIAAETMLMAPAMTEGITMLEFGEKVMSDAMWATADTSVSQMIGYFFLSFSFWNSMRAGGIGIDNTSANFIESTLLRHIFYNNCFDLAFAIFLAK